MTNSRKPTHDTQPHDSKGDSSVPVGTVAQIFLGALLRVHPIIRWPALIIAGLALLLFGIWSSLPASIQETLFARSLNIVTPTTTKPNNEAKPTEPPQVPARKETPTKTETRDAGEFSYLLIELEEKKLFSDLEAAESFQAAQTENNVVDALERYDRVLLSLSPKALAQLDKPLLVNARADVESKHLDNAASNYRAAFSRVLKKHQQRRKETNR